MTRPRTRRAWTLCALLGVLACAASAAPVFSANGGSVNAQVTAIAQEDLCIIVSPSGAGQSVNFGTLPFNAVGSSEVASGSPDIQVTNCGTGTQTILARGTDATGGAGAGIWFLVDGAISLPNLYKLGLGNAAGTTFLSLSNVGVGSHAPNVTTTFTPRIVMPIAGSSGGGQTFSMSYVFTATV